MKNTNILIRLMVGGVFFVEGVQKFLLPELLGVGRFEKIGIPAPALMAPFVGGVEIVFGLFLMIGFFTKKATIPLLIDIVVAILTTKLPMLSAKGFWPTIHEARTDYCMLLGLIFLLFSGSGLYSYDARRGRA